MVSLFSESLGQGYITIGDDYDKKLPVDLRNVGLKCFTTSPSKKGKGPDVTFDWNLRNKKFLSLSEGDKYMDPGTKEKREKLESAKRFVGGVPWKYTGPPKKSAGKGNWYGTFWEADKKEGPPRHETEYDVVKKGEMPPKLEPRPRNILTTPAKKGTYGVPGTLLSNAFGGANADWNGTEYICDPYDNARKKQREQQLADRQLLAERPPFKATCKKKRFFDETNSAGVSSVYRLDRPLKLKPPQEKTDQRKVEAPWKPPHQGKSGLGGLFGDCGKFMEYREDPYEFKEQKEREAREKEKPKFGTWKPVSVSKSLHTRSIEFGGVW